MNLYKISQTENKDYDSFDSAIVAAETEEDARNIHPQIVWESTWGTERADWWGKDEDNDYYVCSSWCKSPEAVTVVLIGTALPGTNSGVVLASFNAG